jgi:prephenate dehydrogenase
VALGVRERLPGTGLRVWARREAAYAELRALGFGEGELATDLVDVAQTADLIVLATPVGSMPLLARMLVDAGLRKTRDVIVTDVGSVKAEVERGVGAFLRGQGITFVGSHPMAGSEKAGLSYAKADLFSGAKCIVTEGSGNVDERDRVVSFWQELGATVAVMSAAEHDRVVARVSHVPHAGAAAIALTALGPDPGMARLSGGGLRDTTRVASGPPEMWAEILLENGEEVTTGLRELQDRLSDLLVLLEKRDKEGLITYLNRARELREWL